MTLVVARISGSRIAIASDTLLTENGAPLPISKGVIKSCCLGGGLVVSFANSPELAWRDCWKFYQTFPTGADFAVVTSYFELSSKQTGNDYIICFASNPKIIKIANGKREAGASKTLWIGDKSAYEKFREYEARERANYEKGRAINAVLFADEIEDSPASSLYSTMRNLLLAKDVETVGGFVCVLSNRDKEFRHSAYCDILYDWPIDTRQNYNFALNDPVHLGSTNENEEYSISQISTAYGNFNCVCFYILRAKTAYLFYPTSTLIADTCKVMSSLEAVNIPARLHDAMKIDLGWLAFVASGPKTGISTTFRDGITVGTNGVQFGMMVHCNTFPPSGITRDLPKLEWRVPDEIHQY